MEYIQILPKLFTKFVTKSDTGGTGLGLFISKSIIEKHGESMWANNNVLNGDTGATFAFSLPISMVYKYMEILNRSGMKKLQRM